MNDALLRAVTKAKVHLSSWARETSRDRNRRLRGDRGQTAVEYLGIIVVVVAIVVAITGTDIGQTIKGAITNKIAELTGN
ncbi:Flp family type IVb pilin [Streptomyces sp. NBC_01216]|uniref:Flp family type IVb pilin n=1 Tax=Streptomyces sp. NBC_01216 TaxID=2903778 RepID=UPI002E11ADA3|nr:Flp family type IVb pilin [Streptomyces sp. NBC_01216]